MGLKRLPDGTQVDDGTTPMMAPWYNPSPDAAPPPSREPSLSVGWNGGDNVQNLAPSAERQFAPDEPPQMAYRYAPDFSRRDEALAKLGAFDQFDRSVPGRLIGMVRGGPEGLRAYRAQLMEEARMFHDMANQEAVAQNPPHLYSMYNADARARAMEKAAAERAAALRDAEESRSKTAEMRTNAYRDVSAGHDKARLAAEGIRAGARTDAARITTDGKDKKPVGGMVPVNSIDMSRLERIANMRHQALVASAGPNLTPEDGYALLEKARADLYHEQGIVKDDSGTLWKRSDRSFGPAAPSGKKPPAGPVSSHGGPGQKPPSAQGAPRKTAVNPDTGERLELVDGQWVPVK